MSDGKPVEVMRGSFGGWFSVSASKDAGNGDKIATRRNPISNADQLEEMLDAQTWLKALMRETGKTRIEIAADYNLEIFDHDGKPS